MNKQVKKPNVVRGGIAIPLGRNYYYMAGRKHKNGGIDIGKNPRTGLEVEDGEVMHISDKNVKVFSSVPFLNGKSPAQKVLGGENPDAVFKQQESFKDRNGINDDGTKKKALGGEDEQNIVTLPEVVVTPEKWQTDFINNFGDKNIRNKIYETLPNRVASYKYAYDLHNANYDKDKIQLAINDFQKSRDNNYEDININQALHNLYNVWNDAGKPKITSKDGPFNLFFKNRPNYSKPFNTIHVPNKTLTDIISELAHPIQFKFGNRNKINNYLVDGVKAIYGELFDNRSHYRDPNHYEFETHSVIEPVLKKYIYGNDTNEYIKLKNKKRMGGLSRSKNYKSNSKSYSKEGGIYSITANGKTKMRMLSSTGGRTKAPFGIDYKLPDIIGINPNENDKYVETMLEPINKLVSNTQQPYTVKQNNSTTIKKHNLFSNTENPFKMTKGDTISLASNIGGSLISAGINALALKNLKVPSRPISAPAAKLKTRININPQLDRMRETIAEYERNVDNNTLSSRVALARKQNARLNSILQTNELYGAKENAETELINKDKINRQTVAAENVKAYNDWRDRVNAFENEIVDKKSENLVSMIGNINQGLQDVVSRNEQRDAERQTRLAMSAAHPNVNPRILKALGIKGITDEDIARWEKAFYSKK